MPNLRQQVAPPQNDNAAFIYGLVDPRTGYVRYVGKAKDTKKRLKEHLIPSSLRRDDYKARWIKSILRLELKPEVIILEAVIGGAWQKQEEKWIAYFRGIPGYPKLTNGTNGGEGVTGYIATKELREKRSEYRKNNPLSAESLNKISASHKGRKRSQQTRDSMSEAKVKWWDRLTEKEKDIVRDRLQGIRDRKRKPSNDPNQSRS